MLLSQITEWHDALNKIKQQSSYDLSSRPHVSGVWTLVESVMKYSWFEKSFGRMTNLEALYMS